MAAYAALDGDGAVGARLSRQRLGRACHDCRTHSRRRCKGGRARRAGACADGGTDDRGEIEGGGRGGVATQSSHVRAEARSASSREMSRASTFFWMWSEDVDGRVKPGHDEREIRQKTNEPRRTTHETVSRAIGVLPSRGLAIPARAVQ